MAQNSKYEGPGNQILGNIVIPTDTGSHTLIAAVSGMYTDIVYMDITNGSNTNTELAISNGTDVYTYELAPLGGIIVPLGEYPHLSATSGTAWTAQLTVAAKVAINSKALKVQR